MIPTFKNAWTRVYKWFKKELDVQDKVEVTSTTYYIHPGDSKKQRDGKKKLTRMRVIKRKKEANNGI